jgi:hypothetical protein
VTTYKYATHEPCRQDERDCNWTHVLGFWRGVCAAQAASIDAEARAAEHVEQTYPGITSWAGTRASVEMRKRSAQLRRWAAE